MKKTRLVTLSTMLLLLLLTPCTTRPKYVEVLPEPVTASVEVTSDRPEDACYDEAPPPPPASKLPKGSKVMLIGDSLAAGMAPGFTAIAKEAGYVPVVHAIVGTNTKQWVALIKQLIQDHNPSLVVVSLGTNDAVGDLEWIRKNADAYVDLVKLASSRGARVVWITPPPTTSKRVQYVEEVTNHIIDTSVDYFDSASVEIPKAPDQIHSTPTGYKKLIESVWLWMAGREIVTLTSGQ